jgi:PDZ domain/Aspartyl protease
MPRAFAFGPLLLLGIAFQQPAGHAQEKGPPPRVVAASIEIPYRLTDTKHVLVRVKLNGKGPFNFIIDTGAPALITTEAVAKKVGVKSEDGAWVAFDKLELEGGLVVPDAKGLAIDMFQLKGMNSMGFAGVELHGVIGFNILARYRITYDFTVDTLTFTPVPFEKPVPKRIETSKGNGGGGQGGLEMMGDMMKLLAAFTGTKPNYDVVPRGFLGAEINSDLVVQSVLKDGPADKAGLKSGDRIRSAKGKSADKPDELLEIVRKLPAGTSLKLNVKRGDDSKEITVELGRGL